MESSLYLCTCICVTKIMLRILAKSYLLLKINTITHPIQTQKNAWRHLVENFSFTGFHSKLATEESAQHQQFLTQEEITFVSLYNAAPHNVYGNIHYLALCPLCCHSFSLLLREHLRSAL